MGGKVYIDEERCGVCERCEAQKVCKVKAIVRIDRDEAPVVDVHRCYGCRLCVEACRFGAVVSRKDEG